MNIRELINIIKTFEDFNPKTDPTIMSATKKDGNINRTLADKMVDPRGNLSKPKYYYYKEETSEDTDDDT